MGTIGYICPHYSNGGCDYDAKSEIFSFGIVILEVLTGIIQRQNVDGKVVLLHCSIGKYPADIRAGDWPPECAKILMDLSLDCTRDYDERISNMIVVMRRLREIKGITNIITFIIIITTIIIKISFARFQIWNRFYRQK